MCVLILHIQCSPLKSNLKGNEKKFDLDKVRLKHFHLRNIKCRFLIPVHICIYVSLLSLKMYYLLIIHTKLHCHVQYLTHEIIPETSFSSDKDVKWSSMWVLSSKSSSYLQDFAQGIPKLVPLRQKFLLKKFVLCKQFNITLIEIQPKIWKGSTYKEVPLMRVRLRRGALYVVVFFPLVKRLGKLT